MNEMHVESRRGKIEEWLAPPDPSTNYNKALQQRQEGSGLWLMQSEEFSKWKTQQNAFLWLYGIPGCGKTILSSTVIQHLDAAVSSQCLLFFYFDFNDASKQKLDSLIRSLIIQLYSKKEEARELVESLFSASENGRKQPLFESLNALLLQMLDQVGEVWIVLDALDECTTRNELLSWIGELLNTKQGNVHLLGTSRSEHDIRSGVRKFAQEDDMLHIQSDLISHDICAYVHTRVRMGDGLKRWRSHRDVQIEIETALIEKADGMFRWVSCQFDALENCLHYRSLQKTLVSLPRTLDETYRVILQKIPREYKEAAIRILQLLTYSERPLRIEEAVDAIAVDIREDPAFHPKFRMPDPSEISQCCSSLVAVVSTAENLSPVLQLAHFSVKEYLTSDRLEEDIAHFFQEIAARATISTISLAYLLQLDNKRGRADIVDTFPFAQYSAETWLANAAAAEDSDKTLQEFINKFFSSEGPRKAWNLIYRPDAPWLKGEIRKDAWPPEFPGSALFYASFGGLHHAVKWLIDHGAGINTQGGYFGNPLQAAAYQGHKRIVQLLIKHGADVNAQCGFYGNALQAAVYDGHDQIFQLLIECGADINAKGGYYQYVLSCAIYRGQEQLISLLMERGADFKLFGKHSDPIALESAASRGHERIAQLILEHSPDVKTDERNLDKALKIAVSRGHEQLVRLLLRHILRYRLKNFLYEAVSEGHESIVRALIEDHGTDVNSRPGYYADNALQIAASKGHERIVQLLIEHGAGVNKRKALYHGYYLSIETSKGWEHYDGPALQMAASKGHERIVRLLIEHGADVNARGSTNNALEAAASQGHERIVRMLIEHGAKIEAADWYYYKGNALRLAASGGHEQIVQLLIECGADVKEQGYHGTSLEAAASQGHQRIVQLLIKHGADVQAGDALGKAARNGHEQMVRLLMELGVDDSARKGNALQNAARGGHEQTVRLLIEHGVDINAREYHALGAAACEGHEEMVRLFMERGAKVNAREGGALRAAASRGHDRIVQLLIEHGAEVDAGNGDALRGAASLGHEQIVRRLIEHGADVNTKHGYETALRLASSQGHEKIVRLLLEHGAELNDQECDALRVAEHKGHKKIIQLLQEHEAHANARRQDTVK